MSSLGFNTQNRITNPGFSYDAAGNMIAETGRTYQYDAENRMKSVNNGAIATYTYDADGRRVRKVAGSTTTDFIYDLAGSVIAEKEGSTWTVGYIYVNGQLTAQYKDSTTYFVHKDHLGSTRLMTRPDRSIYDSLDYLPYGEQVAGDTGSTHKFTGQERDGETGLDYFGARYYSPSLARFMSPDPGRLSLGHLANPEKWNRYAYTLNNPLRYLDPDGMQERNFLSEFINAAKKAIVIEPKAKVGPGVKAKVGSLEGKLGAQGEVKHNVTEQTSEANLTVGGSIGTKNTKFGAEVTVTVAKTTSEGDVQVPMEVKASYGLTNTQGDTEVAGTSEDEDFVVSATIPAGEAGAVEVGLNLSAAADAAQIAGEAVMAVVSLAAKPVLQNTPGAPPQPPQNQSGPGPGIVPRPE